MLLNCCIDAKYDASYCENKNKLLGRSLSLASGQACDIIVVALIGADMQLEDSGCILHILHIEHI